MMERSGAGIVRHHSHAVHRVCHVMIDLRPIALRAGTVLSPEPGESQRGGVRKLRMTAVEVERRGFAVR